MSKAGKNPSTYQRQLNHCMPIAKDVGLGDILNDLITSLNLLLGVLASYMVTSAGLAIKAGSGVLVKAVNACVAVVNGVPVAIAANTDMAALVGTIAGVGSNDFALWPFYTDGAGTLTTGAMTTPAASLAAAAALLPATPAAKTLIGFIIVQNAQSANADFVGGTTALDAAGVTVTYFNAIGPAPVPAGLAVLPLTSR